MIKEFRENPGEVCCTEIELTFECRESESIFLSKAREAFVVFLENYIRQAEREAYQEDFEKTIATGRDFVIYGDSTDFCLDREYRRRVCIVSHPNRGGALKTINDDTDSKLKKIFNQ